MSDPHDDAPDVRTAQYCDGCGTPLGVATFVSAAGEFCCRTCSLGERCRCGATAQAPPTQFVPFSRSGLERPTFGE